MSNEIIKNTDLSLKDLMSIVQAVSQVYPMIVLANLTKNTYTMIRNDGFLYNDVVNSGCYDDLIDNNIGNIHKNYQNLFLECFSRERLIKSYKKGKTEVYAELYQKNKKGKYGQGRRILSSNGTQKQKRNYRWTHSVRKRSREGPRQRRCRSK